MTDPNFRIEIDENEENTHWFCPFCKISSDTLETPAQVLASPFHLLRMHYSGGADPEANPPCEAPEKWRPGTYAIVDVLSGKTLADGRFSYHHQTGPQPANK